MTTPRFAKLATDLLAEEETPRAPSSEREMQALVAVEAALARRRRSRRILQASSALAIAALIAITVGWSTHREGPRVATPTASTPVVPPSSTPTAIAAKAIEPAEGALVARDGRTESLFPAMTLTSGDRIEASAKGGTGIALADGSLVRIDPGSELSVKALSTTRRFQLTRGSMHADVAKLGPDQRFIIETEDAEVEVHGTSFLVAIREASNGCPSRTRVEVSEGVVSVRSRGQEDRVTAGSSWPACAAAPASLPTSSAPSVRSARVMPAMPGSAPSPAAPTPASSALAAQNALFAKATTARRAGDGPGAVAAYDRLLAEYPDGFLAESATVERMRVLDGMDHARGREAASAYLAHYPNGFARAEAARIAR